MITYPLFGVIILKQGTQKAQAIALVGAIILTQGID